MNYTVETFIDELELKSDSKRPRAVALRLKGYEAYVEFARARRLSKAMALKYARFAKRHGMDRGFNGGVAYMRPPMQWCDDAIYRDWIRIMPLEEKPEAGMKRSALNYDPDKDLVSQIASAEISPLCLLVIDEVEDAFWMLDAAGQNAMRGIVDFNAWKLYMEKRIDCYDSMRLQLIRIWNQHRKGRP